MPGPDKKTKQIIRPKKVLILGSGALKIGEINDKLKRPEYLVLMSLGWLGREGHIVIDWKQSEPYKDHKVTLRK